MRDYFVYLLASQRNGTLYVGVTNDLIRRVHEHREGLADGFTKQYAVKLLAWFESSRPSKRRSNAKSSSRTGSASGRLR